jgi:hypothetical protein
MASTNKTTHYELSQYVSSDKPTYLVDYNGDMAKIDTGINAAKTTADTASTAATNAQTAAENAATTANTAITNAATADTKATTANTNIGTMANLNTTEKTNLVGAINEVNTNTSTNTTNLNLLDDKVDRLEPVLLYNGTDDGTSTITLSQSAANFKTLIFEFYNTALQSYATQELYDPNGKKVGIIDAQLTAGAQRIFKRDLNINGTNVITENNRYAYLSGDQAPVNDTSIKLVKIYGIVD